MSIIGRPNFKLRGRGTSSGLAAGRAFVHRNLLDALSAPRSVSSPEVGGELDRIDRALLSVLEDLKVSALRIEAHSGPKLAAIFGAHEAMLQDSSLRDEIREQIKGELVGAAQALACVFQRWQRKFREAGHETLQERADDLVDLEGRLLREIAGLKTTTLEKMPFGRVLVAHRLLPSETVTLSDRGVIGIILEVGGPGSHAALLARAAGIPTVAEIPDATAMIENEQDVIVDGFAGEVILDPDARTKAQFAERVAELKTNARRAKESASRVARTSNGVEVRVMANVGSREDVSAALENGADGIGLYRSEQFYLGRTTPPSEPELLAQLRDVFASFGPKPITVRLLDLGADKPVSFLNFPVEDDPFLGSRGVRLLLRYPDLLDIQLKALLEFSRGRDLRILVPMVTLAEELAEVRQRLRRIAESGSFSAIPPLGAMIETPAAALSVAEFIRQVDFLCIGTNDLTQYTMAAGRENPLVNAYFLEDHPAVLRLIRIVVEEARQTPVSVCGELAARLDCVHTLIELGVRNLSVAPPLIPGVKEAIRLVHGRPRLVAA